MMSPVASRIHEKLKLLLKEKEQLQNQIKVLNQAINQAKKVIHADEIGVLLESAPEQIAGVPDYRLMKELRNITKNKHTLHDNEKMLRNVTARYDNTNKMIEHHEYWMHRADTYDTARQKEAEKVIFG